LNSYEGGKLYICVERERRDDLCNTLCSCRLIASRFGYVAVKSAMYSAVVLCSAATRSCP
jgi:hypothetical protein